MSEPKWTPGPWSHGDEGLNPHIVIAPATGRIVAKVDFSGNRNLIAAAPTQNDALNYVADMTYCGSDCEWHFKPGYDPQVVLDALAQALGDKP
jgi:hypothetical protein